MKGAILAADGALRPDGDIPPPWPARRVPGAEPAVYVHGLGGSSQNFTDVAGLLADRFDGQAVDLPGFGYSDPSPRYSIASFAATQTNNQNQTGRSAEQQDGNSLGGSIAVRVAALRPDLIR